MKAYRMTKDAVKMFKDNDFSPDSIKDLHISFETMFTQVPIVVRNSHLMNALLLDIQDQLPRTGGEIVHYSYDSNMSNLNCILHR